MSPADELLDRTVRHQVGLLRYSNATVQKAVTLLARVEADVLAQLRSLDPQSYTFSRLETQLASVRQVQRQGYDQLAGLVSAEMDDLAAYEATFTARQAGQVLGATFDVPSRESIITAVNSRPFQGRFLREWMRGLDEDAGRRIRDAVRMGFVEGEGTRSIMQRVRGTRAAGYNDGILAINRRSAERVIRTAVNHTASRARNEVFNSNDLVSGVQWTSVLDSRTSIVCAGRDGKVYPKGSGPRPPAHPNCRSQITAVLDGFPPPERVTYEQWLRRQPTEVQNDVLGTARARAWRRGDVPLDRFVSKRGDTLTLQELAAKEGISL